MSESHTFSSPPDFSSASRGYWGYEVDRLITDLEAAQRSGEELGPIIAERKLSEVGFGYDMEEVDTYLRSLPGGQGARESTGSSNDANPVHTPRTSAPQPTHQPSPPTAARSAPPTTGTRAAPSPVERSEPQRPVQAGPPPPSPEYEVLEPYVPEQSSFSYSDGNHTWTGSSAAILAEIRRGRMLPAPGPTETGYDARSVNQFLSQLDAMVRNNQSITEALQNCRLNFARQGTPSYAISNVDALLNSLKRLASNTGMATNAVHTPRSSFQMTQTTKSTGRTAIAAKIIRIVGFVIFAFVIFSIFWS